MKIGAYTQLDNAVYKGKLEIETDDYHHGQVIWDQIDREEAQQLIEHLKKVFEVKSKPKERYDKVRMLTAAGFDHLQKEIMRTGKTFDMVVDEL